MRPADDAQQHARASRAMMALPRGGNLMLGQTNRRGFIAGLGSAAVWPVMARGQQPLDRRPLIGMLLVSRDASSASPYINLSPANPVCCRPLAIRHPASQISLL
jgi:hypothetical protein